MGRLRPDSPGVVPMNPVTTMVIQRVGAERPDEVRQEFWVYTPEQMRAMGKTISPLNKNTVVDWIARVGDMTDMNADDLIALARECMIPEDFGALSNGIQMATLRNNIELLKELYTFYWPGSSLVGRIYTERQTSLRET